MALRSQSPSDRNSTDGRVYSFSALPKAMLEDIVILTGAQAISEDLGPRSPSLSPTRAREALMIAGAGGAMRATGWRATAIRFQQLGEGATRWCRLLTTSPNSWPTAAARRRQNHPAAQSLLPWRTSVIRQCLNLTRPESGNPKKSRPFGDAVSVPLASDRSEPFRSNADCCAALFIKADWVSKR